MRIYGLTGSIGSGKSAAAARFAERGLPVIDADAIGHEIIAPGGLAEQAVLRHFGPDIVSCGKIDRVKLAQRVFSDPEARRTLNVITHPIIFAEIGRRCAELVQQGHADAMIEAALLGEGGAREPSLAGLVLVTCDPAERLRRLVVVRGMAPEEVRRRMAAQCPDEAKAGLADWVIDNNGAIEALYARVDAVFEEINGVLGRS